MLAAAVAGYNMVEGQMAASIPAVLAGIAVAVENLVAGHFPGAAGPADEMGEADNGGELDRGADRVDIAEAVLDHLRFALEDKDDGAAGAADRERLVALVEDEDGMVNHGFFHRYSGSFYRKKKGRARMALAVSY